MLTKIVYLDDEADLCKLIAECLRDMNFDVRAFVDADEAVESMVKDPPDVALLDFRLKGTTGVEVAGKIDPNIKKFLITGELDLPVSPLFKKIIRKPLDIGSLLEAINEQVQ